MLRMHYEQKIPAVCKMAGLPEKCSNTAIMFFKRFYLAYTVMDYDPKMILLTCIYLTTKTEECRVVIDDLSRRLNLKSPDPLLQHEMILLQGIKFELQIYHPFRPLQGFIMNLNETAGVDTTEVRNQAITELNNAMTTDLPLLYSPSFLALAALVKVAKQVNNSIVLQYVTSTLTTSPDAQQTINEIVGIMESSTRITLPVETVRGLDKKLKQCPNPEMNPDSEQSRKKANEKDAQRVEKQKQKAAQLAAMEKADLEMLTGRPI